MKKNKKL